MLTPLLEADVLQRFRCVPIQPRRLRRVAALRGQVTEGDGFRSLYSGTLEAAGCDDAAFNGSYDRFHLERFSQSTLAVHLKRGEGTQEASVEAVMSLRTPP